MDVLLPGIYSKLKRGPQIILPKDIGIIISYAGVGKDSICVDAGTGSGWLAVSLGRVAKKVYSYEIRSEFAAIAKRNIAMLGLDNVEIKDADVTKGIRERDVDIVVLDMPGSDKVVRHAAKALRSGGVLVGYLPHMEQVKAFVSKMEKYHFDGVYTVEVIVRDILVRDAGVRPSTKGIWHTAYLVFGKLNKEKI
jgi:tRNA(1-methyladenosine) methyltransferase and related methyltransferases